ncbi:hypothetical protein KUV50_12875 [Membranicola marinus]|uniref:Uncharacterized protein n=1 Tax=Membranihabitans marinus TaxID=1227546 RepID=A0A953L7T2_9BACT|nr:hypothetical protein [Membranihabitans marinus]MBY5959037.1 hypothetical protein [Membranihabitans marinus]
MKKRLDVQSLLEASKKEDLVHFLKNCFAKNKSLTNDFLIHFASTFELDETEFHLITDRIHKMLPGRLASLSHRKANPVKKHLQNLMEQTRDCHSRENFRQAYVIISHVILLLDAYTDIIPEKFGFKKLQKKSYQLLDHIYQESPAPSLKSTMRSFLRKIIQEGKAIPFDEQVNPYLLLLDWEKEIKTATGSFLIDTLNLKIKENPEYRGLWLSQQTQILIDQEKEDDLIELIQNHADDQVIYQTFNRYLPKTALKNNLLSCLKEQYQLQSNRQIKNEIYHILKKRDAQKNGMIDIALQEFFQSGDFAILEDLVQQPIWDESTLVRYLEEYITTKPEIEQFHLYSAYKFLERPDLLKDQLLYEENIFEILPFLGAVYPEYKAEIQNKITHLIEIYLTSHFGRPAINYLNNVLAEINRLGHYDLHDYLIRKIRHNFGHRKHFQKLMKELV